MKLSVVFPVFNQHELATAAIDVAIHNLSREHEVEFVILDNGSNEPFDYQIVLDPIYPKLFLSYKLVRSEKNIGVYPTFWLGLKEATGDVLAFLHSDVMVAERGWDKRVIEAFKADPKLGLVGFIGSNEIDGSGGRGLGTASNFMGGTYGRWTGSSAEVHGRRLTGMEPAAVVDGCVMVFRRICLETIPERKDFPPHHFYDRLLSCEVREKGWTMATLGVGFDHISGQTVNQEQGYSTMAEEWCVARGLKMEPYHNWDTVVYKEAESRWLGEYRDSKHLVPCKV